MNITGNKILITGGASGIGLGLTERFIRENNTVLICGRRESVLNEVSEKFPSVITKVCDLSVEAERIDLFNWVSEHHSDLNVLVNNAGIQQWMSLSDPDFYQRAKDEITTNIEAPIHLTAPLQRIKIIRYDYQCNVGFIVCSTDKSAGIFGHEGVFPFVYALGPPFIEGKKY